MSSVLVESSEIAELHSVLDKLAAVSGGADVKILTEQMQSILQPYKVDSILTLHSGLFTM